MSFLRSCCLFVFLQSWIFLFSHAIQVNLPGTPSSNYVVYPNFLGISFELSFMAQYFGNDTSTMSQPMINYLAGIRAQTGSKNVRLRIGGNSADSSHYNASQTNPMVSLTDPTANANDQPVTYGSMLWSVMRNVSDTVNGVEYLIGMTLNDPNNTDAEIASDAKSTLGNWLDGILLGNEPDLYTAHGQRPNLKNYTVQDYIGEFTTVANHLQSTTFDDFAGPTVCCDWDLATLLQQGYLSLSSMLKYITLQHYPQNNCFGSYQYQAPWYLQHANVVQLAAWQSHGINIIVSNTSSARPQMVMSEFNSASCGGIPGISDTFGVGSLWTVDYALQLATVGYSAAYIHTRERGISYNIVAPPPGVDGGPGAWTTNPPYYSLLVMAEALQTHNGGGSIVMDLDLGNSTTDIAAQTAGYAVYDAQNSSVTRLILFNYANSSTQFSLPSDLFAKKSKNPVVKFLAATSAFEKSNISWSGQTFVGVSDGTQAVPATWATPDLQLECSNGCSFDAPGPSLAMVFVEVGASTSASTSANTTSTTGTTGTTSTTSTSNAPSTVASSLPAGSGAQRVSGSISWLFVLSLIFTWVFHT